MPGPVDANSVDAHAPDLLLGRIISAWFEGAQPTEKSGPKSLQISLKILVENSTKNRENIEV